MSNFNESKLNSLIVFALGLAFSLYVAVSVMRGGVTQLTYYGGLIAGLTWIILGQKSWWMPIPLTAVFGGLIWVGFRVYTHEIATAFAFAALIPALILDRRSYVQSQRPRLPVAASLLLLYLLIHMVSSWVLAGPVEYRWSIVRTYANALWPVVFFIYYYKYGSSRNIDRLLFIVYAVLIIRCSIGLYSYFFPNLLYFAGSSFLFVFSMYGENELRGPSLQLVAIALSLATRRQSPLFRSLHFAVAGIAFWLLLLGSSRAGFVMSLVALMIIAFVHRRFIVLSILSIAVGVIIVALNMNPHIINDLPTQAQRALSVLAPGNNNLRVLATIEGSNEWHAYLFKTGWQRWSESVATLLVGNRVHPYDDYFLAASADMFARADIAAKTTRYEKMIWTVTATLGLTGAILYGLLYFHLFKGPFRALIKSSARSKEDSIYMIALIQVSLTLLFALAVGGFPSFDLVWGALALGLYYDRKAESKKSPSEPATAT
jgi:hypothetical protein